MIIIAGLTILEEDGKCWWYDDYVEWPLLGTGCSFLSVLKCHLCVIRPEYKASALTFASSTPLNTKCKQASLATFSWANPTGSACNPVRSSLWCGYDQAVYNEGSPQDQVGGRHTIILYTHCICSISVDRMGWFIVPSQLLFKYNQYCLASSTVMHVWSQYTAKLRNLASIMLRISECWLWGRWRVGLIKWQIYSRNM